MGNNRKKSEYTFDSSKDLDKNNDAVSVEENISDSFEDEENLPVLSDYPENTPVKTEDGSLQKSGGSKAGASGKKTNKKRTSGKRNLYLVLGLIGILALMIIYFVFIQGNFGKLEPAQEGVEAGSKIKDYVSLVKFRKESDEDKYRIEYAQSNIKLDEVGSYPAKYMITNKEDGQIIEEEVKIKVIDTTPPEIISYKVVIDKGNDFNPQEMIKVRDNAKGGIEVSIENGEVNTSQIGSYGIKVRAEDGSGNSSSKNIKVFVKTSQSQFFSDLEKGSGSWVEEGFSESRKHKFFERDGERYYKVEGRNAMQIKIDSMDVDVSGSSAVLYGNDLSYPEGEGKVSVKVEIIEKDKEIAIMMYDAGRGEYSNRVNAVYSN